MVACSGRASAAFPYGSRFRVGACNTLEEGRDEAVAPLEYKKCRSPFRIYAMAGNLAEWTASGSGFVLKGGSYAQGGSESRCRGRLQSGAGTAQPDFGVRCCVNPTYK
jgi:formylglycine-generating enzyme required for sulfatase activity